MRVRTVHPQDQNGGADDDESHQRADIDHFLQLADGSKRAHHADNCSREHGREVRRAKARMNGPEDAGRQKTVAGHGQENAGLAQKGDQEHARQSRQGPRGDEAARRSEQHTRFASGFGCRGLVCKRGRDRGLLVNLGIRFHARDDG